MILVISRVRAARFLLPRHLFPGNITRGVTFSKEKVIRRDDFPVSVLFRRPRALYILFFLRNVNDFGDIACARGTISAPAPPFS